MKIIPSTTSLHGIKSISAFNIFFFFLFFQSNGLWNHLHHTITPSPPSQLNLIEFNLSANLLHPSSSQPPTIPHGTNKSCTYFVLTILKAMFLVKTPWFWWKCHYQSWISPLVSRQPLLIFFYIVKSKIYHSHENILLHGMPCIHTYTCLCGQGTGERVHVKSDIKLLMQGKKYGFSP